MQITPDLKNSVSQKNDIFKVLKERGEKTTYLKLHIQWKYPSKLEKWTL